MNIDQVVNATVQLKFGGEAIGSGFRFQRDDVVVTCSHVLPPSREDIPLTATDGTGEVRDMQIVEVSPGVVSGGYDYAILHTDKAFSEASAVLQPRHTDPSRGEEVIFAGHPFDLAETLTHTGVVSGYHERGFYLDGSVNFRNSGGPIVDVDHGEVIGMITGSKIHEDKPLAELIDDLSGLHQKLLQIDEVRDTTIHGVDVEQLAVDGIQTVQDAMDLLAENICSGVGIANSISYVLKGGEGESVGMENLSF